MRSNCRIICLGLFIVLSAAGCESTRWNWLKRDSGQDVAAKPGASPTVVGLVAYLNENASRVQSVRFEDMSVDATLGSQSFGLRGRLLAEKPRNFRMKATVLGKDEADIGSNAQEFWFWIARNPEPHQYFCSYRDLEEGRVKVMPLPIQPDWVMETLGLGPYGPADKYKLENDPDAKLLRLVEKSKSPQGVAVRKVIVMNRKEVRAPQPQVTAYLLLDDATGQEICSAHILSTAVDRTSGVIVPYKMELRMPKEKMKLALKMDGMAINATIPPTAFVRAPMGGVDPFNLAAGPDRGPVHQQAQGLSNDRGVGATWPSSRSLSTTASTEIS